MSVLLLVAGLETEELDGETFALDCASVSLEDVVVAELDETTISLDDEVVAELDGASISFDEDVVAELEEFSAELDSAELEISEFVLGNSASELLERSLGASTASLALSEHPVRKAAVRTMVADSPCMNLPLMRFSCHILIYQKKRKAGRKIF